MYWHNALMQLLELAPCTLALSLSHSFTTPFDDPTTGSVSKQKSREITANFGNVLHWLRNRSKTRSKIYKNIVFYFLVLLFSIRLRRRKRKMLLIKRKFMHPSLVSSHRHCTYVVRNSRSFHAWGEYDTPLLRSLQPSQILIMCFDAHFLLLLILCLLSAQYETKKKTRAKLKLESVTRPNELNCMCVRKRAKNMK